VLVEREREWAAYYESVGNKRKQELMEARASYDADQTDESKSLDQKLTSQYHYVAEVKRINADFDKQAADAKKQKIEEAKKLHDEQRKQLEAEQSAGIRGWAEYYKYTGDENRASLTEALAGYVEEATKLQDLQVKGENVRNQMYLATLKYANAVKAIQDQITQKQKDDDKKALDDAYAKKLNRYHEDVSEYIAGQNVKADGMEMANDRMGADILRLQTRYDDEMAKLRELASTGIDVRKRMSAANSDYENSIVNIGMRIAEVKARTGKENIDTAKENAGAMASYKQGFFGITSLRGARDRAAMAGMNPTQAPEMKVAKNTGEMVKQLSQILAALKGQPNAKQVIKTLEHAMTYGVS
jgi:hypothetical protein